MLRPTLGIRYRAKARAFTIELLNVSFLPPLGNRRPSTDAIACFLHFGGRAAVGGDLPPPLSRSLA
jgi:hypothetical protein